MPTRNCYPVLIVWAATARAGKSRSYISNIVPARLAESVWCKKKLQSSLYFLLSGFQPSLLLIYFSDSLSGCSHCTKVWHKKPIRYATFHFRDRRCAPSLRHRKSRRNHQIRHDFRGDPNTIRYYTNIPRRLQEKAKEKKKEKASLSSYSVNRIHLRPL